MLFSTRMIWRKDEEKDEENNGYMAKCILWKNIWSSGWRHTKQPTFQNGYFHKNFSLNHPCCKMVSAAFKCVPPKQHWRVTTLYLSFFYGSGYSNLWPAGRRVPWRGRWASPWAWPCRGQPAQSSAPGWSPRPAAPGPAAAKGLTKLVIIRAASTVERPRLGYKHIEEG